MTLLKIKNKIIDLLNVGSNIKRLIERQDTISARLDSINEKLDIINDNDPRKPQQLFYKVCEVAQENTIDFIYKNMKHAICITDYEEFLAYSVKEKGFEGDIMEFGVYSGSSINQFSKLAPDVKIYGFDSFEGLPEVWNGYHIFDFNLSGNLPKVNENIQLIKGWFDESLPFFLQNYNGKCALLHIDCDLYSSTKTVFDHIYPYLDKGSVVIFDEFFNYPNYEEHEMKAFFEFVEKREIKFQYLAYCGERVVVKII